MTHNKRSNFYKYAAYIILAVHESSKEYHDIYWNQMNFEPKTHSQDLHLWKKPNPLFTFFPCVSISFPSLFFTRSFFPVTKESTFFFFFTVNFMHCWNGSTNSSQSHIFNHRKSQSQFSNCLLRNSSYSS